MGQIVTLLTDFGVRDAYAGVLHGVILGIAPHVTVVDLSHGVPPQDVRAGAFGLMAAFGFFPAGTIHVAIVDPGVGTARKIVAARAGGHTFVGPDNGLLKWAVDRAGGPEAAVSVEAAQYRLPVTSVTFHGRDIIAPAAAHLANGVPLSDLGPPIARLAGEPFPEPAPRGADLEGHVVYVDRYGNCVTNLPPLPGTPLVLGKPLRRCVTYEEGAEGEAVALTGSAGFLEIAVRGGSAAGRLGISSGTKVILRR